MTTTDDSMRSRWNLVFLTLAIAFACVMYRVVAAKKLEQTALLFIGIPTVLAVLVAMTPRAKTATGGILKATTIALLLSAPLLGEGFICILMASPIFYLVAVIIGRVVDAGRARNQTTLSILVLLGMLPMSLEGTHARLSFNRDETVQASRIVNASAADVERALSSSPRTGLPLPYYLRLGFPRPVRSHGSGLEVGDLRTIHFAGGEGQPGDLVMKVTESRPGHLRFSAVSDASKVAHWLDWESAEVEWRAIDATHTNVTWKLSFRRLLDPAWYFRPWERYATRLAADYLIEANATPDVHGER